MSASICVPYMRDWYYQNQWDFVLSHFEVSEVFILGEIDKDWKRHKYMSTAKLISSVNDLPSDTCLVVMTPKEGRHIRGEIALPDFKHPDNVIYLFGPDSANLSFEISDRVPDSLVYIPTRTNDEMFSFVAGAITLYDRAVKNG